MALKLIEAMHAYFNVRKDEMSKGQVISFLYDLKRSMDYSMVYMTKFLNTTKETTSKFKVNVSAVDDKAVSVLYNGQLPMNYILLSGDILCAAKSRLENIDVLHVTTDASIYTNGEIDLTLVINSTREKIRVMIEKKSKLPKYTNRAWYGNMIKAAVPKSFDLESLVTNIFHLNRIGDNIIKMSSSNEFYNKHRNGRQQFINVMVDYVQKIFNVFNSLTVPDSTQFDNITVKKTQNNGQVKFNYFIKKNSSISTDILTQDLNAWQHECDMYSKYIDIIQIVFGTAVATNYSMKKIEHETSIKRLLLEFKSIDTSYDETNLTDAVFIYEDDEEEEEDEDDVKVYTNENRSINLNLDIDIPKWCELYNAQRRDKKKMPKNATNIIKNYRNIVTNLDTILTNDTLSSETDLTIFIHKSHSNVLFELLNFINTIKSSKKTLNIKTQIIFHLNKIREIEKLVQLFENELSTTRPILYTHKLKTPYGHIEDSFLPELLKLILNVLGIDYDAYNLPINQMFKNKGNPINGGTFDKAYIKFVSSISRGVDIDINVENYIQDKFAYLSTIYNKGITNIELMHAELPEAVIIHVPEPKVIRYSKRIAELQNKTKGGAPSGTPLGPPKYDAYNLPKMKRPASALYATDDIERSRVQKIPHLTEQKFTQKIIDSFKEYIDSSDGDDWMITGMPKYIDLSRYGMFAHRLYNVANYDDQLRDIILDNEEIFEDLVIEFENPDKQIYEFQLPDGSDIMMAFNAYLEYTDSCLTYEDFRDFRPMAMAMAIGGHPSFFPDSVASLSNKTILLNTRYDNKTLSDHLTRKFKRLLIKKLHLQSI
jgi:hypothetical protein